LPDRHVVYRSDEVTAGHVLRKEIATLEGTVGTQEFQFAGECANVVTRAKHVMCYREIESLC